MLALVFASIVTLLAALPEPGVPELSTHPQPITGSTVAVADRARDLITQIQEGKVDRSLLTPGFNAVFTDAAIAADAGFLGGRGKPDQFGLLARTDVSGDVRYVFFVRWDAGAVAYTFGIDKATGLIDACYFRAAATPPPG